MNLDYTNQDVFRSTEEIQVQQASSQAQPQLKRYSSNSRLFVPKPIKPNTFAKLSNIGLPKLCISEEGLSTRLAKEKISTVRIDIPEYKIVPEPLYSSKSTL